MNAPRTPQGPSIPDEPDDAELIAACAEFDALERAKIASYDNPPDARDSHTTLLAVLLHEMVAPARNAIIALRRPSRGKDTKVR